MAHFGIRKNPRNKGYNFDNADYLYEQYVSLGKTPTQIAEENHVSVSTIEYYLNVHKIKRKKNRRKLQSEEDINKVIDMYVNQRKSTRQISEYFNVNKGAISKILKENNVHIRNLRESRFDYIPKELDDYDLLKELYINKKMGTQDIADMFNNMVDRSTVLNRLKKFDIPIRSISETLKGKLAKEKHPNWKGGITELYDMLRRYFHENIAPIAWKRDKKTCFICGKHRDLHAHHIKQFKDIVNEIINEHCEYDITNDHDKYELYNIIINDSRFIDADNLITVCKNCHLQIHRKKINNWTQIQEMKDEYMKGTNYMKVIKRDGREVEFNKQKIRESVQKAFMEVDGEVTSHAKDKAAEIARHIESLDKDLSVEEIQDIVEDKLMASNRKDVARAYIIYRSTRSRIRDRNSAWMKAIKEKLAASNVQNQNANVDEHSFGGRKGEADSELMKKIALDDLMSEMARENHLNNEIYIHDLDAYAVGMHNCLSIPFDKLLANGFNTRQTDVRPAQSVNTAFQLVAVIFQLQSLQQFGGVSATHLDWTMVPYVRKSFYKHYIDGLKYVSKKEEMTVPVEMGDKIFKLNELPKEILSKTDINDTYIYNDNEAYQYAMDMTIKEVYQAVEGMYHNLNTLQSRSGNQLPFTSINYGTCTLPEGRMVTKALLDVSIKGIGKLHKTPIFPCGIFQYMKGVNDKPDTPNYDLYRLALQSTARRLYPNYANVDWSVNAGYDVNNPKTYFSTMGCRTSNGLDINGLGQLKDGRGNICPVTIIMPTLAMEAKQMLWDALPELSKETITVSQYEWTKGDIAIEYFMKLLDKKIHEAKDMLIERFEWICSQSPESAKFMYENGTMEGYIPEEGIRSALKHGTIVIGQLGLAETLQILIGCDHTTEKGMELAKRIEQLFKDRCAEFKQQYKLNFGVYYTPAENLCYTAMKKFQAKYGKIPNVSENDYFTNSTHVPVWAKVNPFEKIDIESQLTGYSNAGCITYVEMPDSAKHNIDALEEIVNYAMDHDIPYFAINVPNDTCLECGYTDEIGDECPMCGSKNIQRLRRVTGYLTGNYTTAFNYGKQKEVEMRTQHTGISSNLEG